MLTITSCYNPESSESFNDLKLLTGEWESYDGVLFNENWKQINNKLLLGEGFSLNGSDTAFYESLQISLINDSVYYSVLFGKKPVEFLLTKASKRKWMFVNSDNEFPNRIEYKIKNDTLLTVVISDMEVNKKQIFLLKKVNN